MVVGSLIRTFFYPPVKIKKSDLGIFCASMGICGRGASFFFASADQGGFLLLHFMLE